MKLEFDIKEIDSEEKIGEGGHRSVYAVGDYAVKVLKPSNGHSKFFQKDTFLASLYYSMKFGDGDLNQIEYKNYHQFMNKIPHGFRENFQRILHLELYGDNSVSVCELVKDYDGKPSRSLKELSVIRNGRFWRRMYLLEEMCLDQGIHIMDLRGNNVVAKKDENGDYSPVFVDYKRMGARVYPLQFWLRFGSQVENRLKRRFKSLRYNHQS